MSPEELVKWIETRKKEALQRLNEAELEQNPLDDIYWRAVIDTLNDVRSLIFV